MAEQENPQTPPTEPTEAPEETTVEETPQEAPDTSDGTIYDHALVERTSAPGVTDAAPTDLDTDPVSSVHTEADGDNKATVIGQPATMAEQKAPKLEGINSAQKAALQRGYFGETAADRAKAADTEVDDSLKVQTNAEAVDAVPSPNQNEEN